MEPKCQSAEVPEEEEMNPSPRYPYVFAFEPSVTEMRHMKRIVRTNEKKSRPRKPGRKWTQQRPPRVLC
ncbi:unnamed protein product [Rhizophagus irregularis]|nr:unnamed protein product [Rhizophagus irregularis]